jgi:hypothetical protein
MRQQTKFWLALLAITIVCYFDFYLYGEGYSVRNVSAVVRQGGHLATLLIVMSSGFLAWKHHPMQWLKKLWMYSYIAGIIFIIIVGGIKTFIGILGEDFLEWVATVRQFFCTPLPYLLVYMLSLIAKQREN